MSTFLMLLAQCLTRELYTMLETIKARWQISVPSLTFSLLTSVVLFTSSLHAAELDIRVLYVKQQPENSRQILTIFKQPDDLGIVGAKVGIADSNTTGRFLKHHYQLLNLTGTEPEKLSEQTIALWRDSATPISAVLVDGDDHLLKLLAASAKQDNMLLINVSNQQDHWRVKQCQARLLHTIPSVAMETDALAQFLTRKRWREWLLINSKDSKDMVLSEAYQRSAKRFGAKIVATREWTFTTDLRRVAQLEVPALTQGEDYDVVMVADGNNQWGFYLPFNTYLPRPVAGTHGLMAQAWHRSIEQWGAVQLQNRFVDEASRPMQNEDYAAWLGVRTVAEAVTRTQKTDPAAIYSYVMSEQFELAAFKGRKLTYRPWNGQLRQPMPIVQPNALVSQSPQEGFLHPTTDLDTLGFDKPEVRCSMRED